MAACASAAVLGGCGAEEEEPEEEIIEEEVVEEEVVEEEVVEEDLGYIASVDEDDPYGSGIHHAKVVVEGYDPFVIELDADAAPVTVANFCALATSGFYNGLTFHRIVDGFCFQGGDPLANGTGGSDDCILGEFSENGVENALADNYVRGTVAMARSSDYNSASCQFFVTLSDDAALSLNGLYAAFGTIDDEGMEIVDQIVADYVGYGEAASSYTISDVENQPVIKKIKITD